MSETTEGLDANEAANYIRSHKDYVQPDVTPAPVEEPEAVPASEPAAEPVADEEKAV